MGLTQLFGADIISLTAIEVIESCASKQSVITSISEDLIVAATTEKRVVPGTTMQVAGNLFSSQ